MTPYPRPYLQNIGPYRVIRPIGRGGAAAVYEVEQPTTGERLALKLLTHPLSGARFEREYQTLATLDHPNIVRVYNYGYTDDQLPYLTMELLDGVPAQAHAKATGRPGSILRTAESVRIAALIADALHYLHERRVVHRDLKSSNVLVLSGGAVKLLDLGTARLMGTDGITRQGEFIGTFTYASPEQLSGRPVDARSDLYSLGVLVYRLLTGRRPFEEDDPRELARLHLEVQPVPPSDIVPQIPATLSGFVLKMLSKIADDRPSSALEVIEAMRATGLGERPHVLGDPWEAPLPLIGRARELRVLEDLLEEPRPGSMAVVLGTDGSGRRRLLVEAAERARKRGCRVYEASCPGPSGLGALVSIAGQAARDQSDGASAESSLNVVREASPAPPAATRLVLFLELFSLLRRRTTSQGRAIVIILHNLHRARLLSLQALRALRLRAADTGVPLVIFATAEADTGDGAPTGTGVHAPLARYFSNALRVELSPLSAPECGQLVAAMLGTAAPSPALAERIRHVASGHPGNVDAMVRAAVRVGGAARGRVALPATPAQALSLHIGGLSRLCQRVLEALSVAGGEAPTDLLGQVADLPASELRAALLALAQDGFLARLDDAGVESWRLRGAILRDTLTGMQSPDRRAGLESRLAAGLSAAPPTASKVRLLAGAGAIDHAITEAVAWAERRVDDGQPEEVLPVLNELVRRVGEAPDTPPALLARLLLCHARALSAVDPADKDADRSLARVGALVSDPVRQAEVDLYTSMLYRRRGEISRARARLSRATRLAEGLPGGRIYASLRLCRAADAADAGNLEIAAAAFEEARRGAERSGELRLAARGRLGVALISFARGEIEIAEREIARVVGSLTRVQDDQGLWRAACLQAQPLRLAGRYSEARNVLTRHRESVRYSGQSAPLVSLLATLAELDLDLHRISEARRSLALAAELDEARLPARVAAALALAQGRLLLSIDQPGTAVDALHAAFVRARAHGLVVPAALLTTLWGVARMRAGDRTGDLVAAEAIGSLAAVGHMPALAQACTARAEALGDLAEPERVFSPIAAWLTETPARAVHASCLRFALRHASLLGDAVRVTALREQLRNVLHDIERHLEPAERTALANHPWYSGILTRPNVRPSAGNGPA